MKKAYVYGLFDPNTDEVFYIGKGTDHRDRTHLKPSMWVRPSESVNPFLYYKIRSLMLEKTPPVVKRLHENLDVHEAFRLEKELIDKYGRRFKDGGKLFNISDTVGGNNTGIKFEWSDERRNRHKTSCKERRIYDPTYDEIYDDYIIKNKRREDIATENGCSTVLVKKRLEAMGITKSKDLRYPPKNEFVCSVCDTSFVVARSVKRKYCSWECKVSGTQK